MPTFRYPTPQPSRSEPSAAMLAQSLEPMNWRLEAATNWDPGRRREDSYLSGSRSIAVRARCDKLSEIAERWANRETQGVRRK